MTLRGYARCSTQRSRARDAGVNWQSTQCLVTGGAGFIGSHLVDALKAAGARVRVLDNFSTGKRENVPAGVEVIEGDIRDRSVVTRAMQGITHVFHEAAIASVAASVEDPVTTDDVNVRGTLHVLEAARACSVQRVMFASSASVYGDPEELPVREHQAPRPASPYAVSKLAGEAYCCAAFATYGLETVPLRYFNVYGPRQDPRSPYSGVISIFLQAVREGRAPTIFGDGQQTRDFIHVSDIVRANLLAAAAPRTACGRAYNCGTGARTSLLQLLDILQQIAGRSIACAFAAARPGDVRHSCADITQIGRVLGFVPRMTLAEGLRTIY